MLASSRSIALLLVVGCTITGCLDDATARLGNGGGTTATPAQSYLNTALSFMQANSIRRKEIDWIAFRATTLADAAGASTEQHTYPALIKAVARLNDGHSRFLTVRDRDSLAALDRMPNGQLLAAGTVGYVALWSLFNNQNYQRYADSLHSLIAGFDRSSTCGWIVDMRNYTGGNMWPMLLGLGPLFDSEALGYFIDPDDQRAEWFYSGGVAGTRTTQGLSVAARLQRPWHTLRRRTAIAVLTGPSTASAGEATVVALVGLPRSRSFGGATAGRATGNTSLRMSDGASLAITAVWFADRSGVRLTGGPLVPAVLVAEANAHADMTGPTVEAALAWLASQPECLAARADSAVPNVPLGGHHGA